MVLVEVWFYFSFTYYFTDLFYSKAGCNKPIQVYSPTPADNKGKHCGQALCHERQ